MENFIFKALLFHIPTGRRRGSGDIGEYMTWLFENVRLGLRICD